MCLSLLPRGLGLFFLSHPVIPSEVEESRGNERGKLFLILAFAEENLNAKN